MAEVKNQIFESKAVNESFTPREKEKRGPQNEGITVNVAEIKWDIKLA